MRPSVDPAWKRLVTAMVLILAVVTAIALWVSHERAPTLAVRSLPPDVRRALYERTMENLRFCDAHPDQDLGAFCTDQATFAASFPDCDKECRALRAGAARLPSR